MNYKQIEAEEMIEYGKYKELVGQAFCEDMKLNSPSFTLAEMTYIFQCFKQNMATSYVAEKIINNREE